MTKLIKTPFADGGDKTTLPVTDASGNVNWTQGFTADYSKDPATDASAKRIEREDFNGLINTISSAVKEIQVNGITPFITAADNGGSAFVYNKGAVVSYNKQAYTSIVDGNAELPTNTTAWQPLATVNNTVGRLYKRIIMKNSGTYTKTPGVSYIVAKVQAGGGGGGGCAGTLSGQSAASGGGCGGFYGESTLIDATNISTVNVVVGSGGTGGAAGANAGNNGGGSAFGDYIIMPGGVGGIPGPALGAPRLFPDNGAIAAASGTSILFSVAGDMGRGGIVMGQLSEVVLGGKGGDSFMGRGGQSSTGGSPAGGTLSNGGGGAGSAVGPSVAGGAVGGNGGAGVVIIEEYI